MLDSTFAALCEEAAGRCDVPALAVGIAVGGDEETFAVGCAPETRFRVAR